MKGQTVNRVDRCFVLLDAVQDSSSSKATVASTGKSGADILHS